MEKPPTEFELIITAATGPAKIAARTGKTEFAIDKWRANGIPEKYWADLIDLSGNTLTIERLYAFNQMVRGRKAAA